LIKSKGNPREKECCPRASNGEKLYYGKKLYHGEKFREAAIAAWKERKSYDV
jgi:hypothetical protein